jgi:phosphoglycolate phosphatase
MIQLIVFDWDGTLADSVSKIAECKSVLAEKYNLAPPDKETIQNVLGTKFEGALAKCFPKASDAILKALGKEFHLLMQEKQYQAELFPQVKEILALLKHRGFKLAVATSKDKHEMAKALQYHGLENTFDMICCGKEYGEKPNPAMLTHIMTILHVRSDETIMIGDTTTDMEFAKNAGVKSIGVTFGAHTHERLKLYEPVAFLSDWTQFTGVLDKLCSMKTYCRL